MNALLLLGAIAVLAAAWRFPAWRPRALPGVQRPPPRTLGHRGTRGVRRENTMPALTLALQRLDGVETDVRRTRDGALVLWHDPECRGREVRASSLAALRAADPEIATLDELLALAHEHPGTLLNVELKSPFGALRGWGLERDAVRAVRRAGLADRVLVSSFDPLALLRVRLVDPGLRIGLLYDASAGAGWRPWECAAWLHADALHPEETLVDGPLLARAHARGLAVNAWTVNDEARVRALVRLGVDGIIADDPSTLRDARDAGLAQREEGAEHEG